MQRWGRVFPGRWRFGIGGLIGFLISGSNVTIPAHYHGSIVGVTLALMGVCYLLLPKLGYPLRNIKHGLHNGPFLHRLVLTR